MFNNQDTRDFIHEHLTVKPVVAKVSREEYLEFVNNYPRDLIKKSHSMAGMRSARWFDAKLVGYETIADAQWFDGDHSADSCLIVKNYQDVYADIQRLLSERSKHHDNTSH